MARIRSIKPEFPQSEDIGKLSRDARLLFVQLWTLADDSGRARAASRMLASLLYPYDDDAPGLIDGWLVELERGEHIRRYDINGSQYLEITNWLKHQKIDRPTPSRLPQYREGSRGLASKSRSLAADLGSGPRILEKDLDQKETRAREPLARARELSDFDAFWNEWPNKVGKPAAVRAFKSAVKRGVALRDIQHGVRNYIRDRPPDRPWLNPATFLNQNRWEDQPAAVSAENGKYRRSGSLNHTLDRELAKSIAEDAAAAVPEDVVRSLPRRSVL